MFCNISNNESREDNSNENFDKRSISSLKIDV